MASKVLMLPRHGGNGSDGADSYRAHCKREARRAQRREGRAMLANVDPVAFLLADEIPEAPTRYQHRGYAD